MDRRSFLAAFALALLGCRPSRSGVTVGSKNFTEQLVLGELLVQYLESLHQAPIDRRFYLAGTYICQQSLLTGHIDMYVEYTGTALAAVLKEKPSQILSRFSPRCKHNIGDDSDWKCSLHSDLITVLPW